jgi:hypothetical protein
MIKAMHDVLNSLHDLDGNLSFKKSALKDAFLLLYDRKKSTWNLSEKNKASWLVSMVNRTANLCRQVSQATKKSSPPSWALELPWMQAFAPPQPSTSSTSPSSSASHSSSTSPPSSTATGSKATFFYRWDTELRNAYRWTEPHGAKEPALRIERPDGCIDTDPITAVWPDGSTHAITSVTVAEFNIMMKQRQSTQLLHTIFEGEVAETHHRIIVKPRQDRYLLCSMYEQGRQILQIPVRKFGAESDPDTMATAGAILAELAKKYCSGEIQKHELKDMKTLKVKEALAMTKGTVDKGTVPMKYATF